MEKQLEYFDVIANNQKQVLSNLVSVQNDLRTQWLGSLSKLQGTISSNVPETAQTKEALNLFNTWYSTLLSTTQSISEESLKTQENWVAAFEKQIAINREVLKSFIDLAKPASKGKVVA